MSPLVSSPAQPVSKQPDPAAQPVAKEPEPKSVVVMSNLDSYIHERMKSQPSTLEEVSARVEVIERANAMRHRLSLPSYFEVRSYDHADGEGEKGPFIFRWVNKDKRSVDVAMDRKGWTFVNRTYFPDAPRHLFTANGGVEVGDAILMFMPARKALELRAEPARRSQERIKSQITTVEADYALMTGNVQDPKVYKPEMPPESQETSEAPVPGVLTEGRDF